MRTALTVGLGITVVAAGAVLSESPPSVLSTNSTSPKDKLAVTSSATRVCQAGERLPRATTAIRLWLGADTGPDVAVQAFSGALAVASGEQSSGWAGESVTVPIGSVDRTVFPVTVCSTFDSGGDEQVRVSGTYTVPATAARKGNGEALSGRMRIEYLGAGGSSWLSLLPSVATHMGLGRAWSGTWVSFLVTALMLTAMALAVRLILRELHG